MRHQIRMTLTDTAVGGNSLTPAVTAEVEYVLEADVEVDERPATFARSLAMPAAHLIEKHDLKSFSLKKVATHEQEPGEVA